MRRGILVAALRPKVGVDLLSQFNAHGVFIVLEENVFFMMSMSILFLAPAIAGNIRIEKVIRWLFVASFLLSAIAFTLDSMFYGIYWEHRFEITTISINWFTVVGAKALLSMVLRRALAGPVDEQLAVSLPRPCRNYYPSDANKGLVKHQPFIICFLNAE